MEVPFAPLECYSYVRRYDVDLPQPFLDFILHMVPYLKYQK